MTVHYDANKARAGQLDVCAARSTDEINRPAQQIENF
jgi:hypothetical protein